MERFLNKILCGKSEIVLKDFPDNSIDSIVTDPPYGLAFMNKKWDYDVPKVELWREVIRVLKPGGHLVSFSGTRTYHRMVCNIEDGGFIIRDMIQWIYGCLSEDTEILTTKGWKRYHKSIEQDSVLCYIKDENKFVFDRPIKSFCYENKHIAYSIKSDFTDQIVSKNHRCIVEQSGRKVFKAAETLECKEDVPFLESLYDLPETIPDLYTGTSIKKQDLLKKVYGKINCKEQAKPKNKISCKFYMSSLWQKIQSQTRQTFKILFKEMQRDNKGTRMEKTRVQRQGSMDRKKHGKLSCENDRRKKSSLERWCNLFQKTWKLCFNKIWEMSERIFTDGTQRRLYYGTSFDNGKVIEPLFVENRSYTSFRSQSAEQQNIKSKIIPEQSSTQKIRSTKATVKPINYKGKVWCVQVDSGAFVARRNGKIFITGNSGFPKNMDISKAMDKQAGVEREVIGKENKKAFGYEDRPWKHKEDANVNTITIPKTEQAKEWDGWGTALKPANEPICLAMKPISEKTIAANVLKWGTGGINIEGCRVGTETIQGQKAGAGFNKLKGFGVNTALSSEAKEVYTPEHDGRWPANVILDEEAGKVLDGQSGYLQSGDLLPHHKGTGDSKIGTFKIRDRQGEERPTYGDSGGASRFFYCPKTSQEERNMGLEDMEAVVTDDGRQKSIDNAYQRGETLRNNDHPTVKPLDLMVYLVKLITPPGGIVLDPFVGSGPTTMAAVVAGVNYSGIDMDDHYCDIARKRTKATLYKVDDTVVEKKDGKKVLVKQLGMEF